MIEVHTISTDTCDGEPAQTVEHRKQVVYMGNGPMKLAICTWCDGESMLGAEVCPQCFGEAVYHIAADLVTAEHSVVTCGCSMCSQSDAMGRDGEMKP